MSNNTENRKNNFFVIYDFFSKKLSDEYKLSFKKLYPKGVTHVKCAEDSVGEFATCFQTWLGNDSSFFCSHYLANSKEDVEKQVQSWGTDKYASFFVGEVDRFTSGLKPKHEKIKLSSWYNPN